MYFNILDWLFPKTCVGCGQKGLYFCPSCQKKIERVFQICPVCERSSPFGKTHSSCQTQYSLDGLISLFAYRPIIQAAIHQLKYQYVTDIENELWLITEQGLSQQEKLIIFEKFIRENHPTVIPIPLFWYKENLRGFNQAGLIGKRLAQLYNLPFSGKLLIRRRHTPTQTKLSPQERQKNVADAFSLSPNYHPSAGGLIANYLLVDDVWTTGATLKTVGNVLKRSGAKKVWGLTLAR